MNIVNGKKRILYIDSGQGFGGSSKYLIDLFKYLDRSRYEPLAACYREGAHFEALRQAGYPVFCLNLPLFRAEARGSRFLNYVRFAVYGVTGVIPGAFKIARLIRKEKIDLLHLNNEILTHLPGILAAKITGCPSVLHFQGYRDLTRAEKFFGAWPTAYLALSHAGAALFAGQLKRPVEPLHHAVDLESYDPARYHKAGFLRDQFPGDRLIGVVGRLVAWKGQDVLLESAAEVLKAQRAVKFLIVGDDPDENKPFRRRLEKKAGDLGISDHVIFMGWRKDVPEIIAQLDIFVHTSREPEPFGIVIIEAMAMAKPVIGTAAGGVPELIAGGETGYLVPPADSGAMTEALLKLLGDEKKALAMGKAARLRAEQMFDIRLNAERLSAVYGRVFERPAGQGQVSR